MNLYRRLLNYQSTSDRSNLENFLTEMLCDYLNRIGKDQLMLFIKDVLLHGLCEETKGWLDHHKNDIPYTLWKTQHPIYWDGTVKYPDLVCFAGNKPILLIEVKVNAQFTQRTVSDELNEEFTISQLQDYGKWLRSENKNAAMILLTRDTHPPSDFLLQDSDYGISTRNVMLWQNIYNWLDKILCNLDDKPCITRDFITFMKEQDMANESPTHSDFSILELFVGGPGMRIGNTMLNCRQELEKKYTQGVRWRSEGIHLNNYKYTIDHEAKIVWSWGIIDDAGYSFIGWGMVFPEDIDIWDLRRALGPLPKEPFIFVALFSENEVKKGRFEETKASRPSGWLWSQDISTSNCIGLIYSALHTMLAYDVDFTSEFCAWVDKHFGDALDIFGVLTSPKNKAINRKYQP